MKKEDIEKAAKNEAEELACLTYYGGSAISKEDVENAFVKGAYWRINSVWHTYEEAKEVDLKKEDVVIAIYPHNIYKIGKLSLYNNIKTNPATGLQETVQEIVVEQPHKMVCLLSKCKAWAYIKDLIPNKED